MTALWTVALVIGFFIIGCLYERRRIRRAERAILRSSPLTGNAVLGELVEQLEDGSVRVAIGAAREHPGAELPAGDVWPHGFNPNAHVGAERRVEIANGHGGVLVLKVRGGAFRVVSFKRPTKFDPVSGEADTTDLWLSVEDLVKAVKVS